MAVGAVNVGEQEQGRPAATLEELLSERIAAEAVRLAEERVREIVSLNTVDPDELHGFMSSEEAAEFLGLPTPAFVRSPLRCPGTRSRRRGSGT